MQLYYNNVHTDKLVSLHCVIPHSQLGSNSIHFRRLIILHVHVHNYYLYYYYLKVSRSCALLLFRHLEFSV